MRLTRAGFAMVIVTIACFAVGRVFGALELFLLGAMAGLALLFAVLFTSSTRLELAIGRTAAPVRLRAGTPARIDLALTNNGKRSTPMMRLRDEVQGTKAATLMLAPVRAGYTATVAYRLPTRRRGELTVGPLDLTIGDPLGLTQSEIRASRDVRLIVHAELIDLGALHAIAGRDPTADQQPIRTLAVGGDEFYALRPYVVGDELRRVHWLASARMGDLVVKQEERPRTGRVTVVLDRNRLVYDVDGFERAISAALSALHAGWRGEDALRFVASGTSRFADVRSRMELDAIDEQLATLTWADGASLVTAIDEISRVGHGGTVVIVTGSPTTELAPSIERARRSFGRVVTVATMPSTLDTPHDIIWHLGESGRFADDWRTATRSIEGRHS
jgi:uncharacterized protein (DUF58 family)